MNLIAAHARRHDTEMSLILNGTIIVEEIRMAQHGFTTRNGAQAQGAACQRLAAHQCFSKQQLTLIQMLPVLSALHGGQYSGKWVNVICRSIAPHANGILHNKVSLASVIHMKHIHRHTHGTHTRCPRSARHQPKTSSVCFCTVSTCQCMMGECERLVKTRMASMSLGLIKNQIKRVHHQLRYLCCSRMLGCMCNRR